ncbi:MAG: LLM class flavin-dependent oxidoreductase [Candidatus Lustribacter sp.]|jgi:alkanesulfonate monooxygenase SsuD/methylene tetrahydromethanopterin reductase-like flavin-dependent oxidoreductase (luciferase family)
MTMHYGNRLKLGMFAANCSSGRTATTVPERWTASWYDNLALATAADEAGIDFMLPIGRWKGYGGSTDYQGTSFETLTWASGLLQATKRITVFGTVHAPLFHPIIAAKQIVTADHIGQGRFGLNLVCGWNEDEFEMFGIDIKGHADRYAHGAEWLRVLRLLWSDTEDVDFGGDVFHLKGLRGKPKPYGGVEPLIMNAGASPSGQAFAVANCDAYFTGIRTSTFDDRTGSMEPDLPRAVATAESVRDRAAAVGREIGVFSRAEIYCRPTQAEAYEYYRYASIENADWGAVEGQLEIFGVKDDGSPEFEARKRQHVQGFPIIGDPDRVARALADISRAGFDGLAMSFVNYLDELPYFRDEVLPRLAAAGLRRAPSAT